MTELIEEPAESSDAGEVSDQASPDLASPDQKTPDQEGPDQESDRESSDHIGVDQTGVDGAGNDIEDAELPEDGLLKKLEREGDIAADYLEELLDIADLDGDLDMDVDGDRAAVSIVGADLQQLVGTNGAVLDALQELTRLAVFRETGERSRLMLDISGFRANVRAQLVVRAGEAIEQVKASGEATSLEPMTPFERKVVHDAVAAAGLVSESSGTEPRRYVVVLPS